MSAVPSDARVLDLLAPLPGTGLHLIEASAGTGKTYTLEALVARYIAETDLPISRLLLVTFTNDAAAELRSRVRRRLHILAKLMVVGSDGATLEPVERHIVESGDQAVVLDRLQAALRDFDQATITTIHAFAQQVLTQAGLDHNPTLQLRTDVGSVAVDVAADELARRSLALDHADDDGRVPKLTDVLNGLKIARNRPGIPILPHPTESERLVAMGQLLRRWEREPAPDPAEIASYPTGRFSPRSKDGLKKAYKAMGKQFDLADAVRTTTSQLSDELMRRNEFGFSELLTQADELVHRSPRTAHELRSRYHLVLVDEFQDTDPVQWSLLSTLFTDLGAEAEAPHEELLDASPRPQTPVARAEPLRLFEIDRFDQAEPQAEYPASDDGASAATAPPPTRRPVSKHITVLVGDPKQAIYGFRGGDVGTYRKAADHAGPNRSTLTRNFRSQATLIDGLNELLHGAEFGSGVGYIPIEAHRPAVAQDAPAIQVRTWDYKARENADLRRAMVADDLADLVVELTSDPSSDVSYGEIAVLYSAHLHGPPILRALQARGIPAVITRGETVFNTPAVAWWRRLLWALERPTNPSRVRNAVVAPIVGCHPDQLSDDDFVRRAQADLRTLASVLEMQGVAAALRKLLRDWEAAARLLERPGGERHLVDIEHVGELLHLETHGEPVSPTALRELLEELLLADPDDADYAADLNRRRLDTEADDNVVRIMSIHTAKGLQFDVVLCPTLSDKGRRNSPVHYHPDDEQSAKLGMTPGSSALRFVSASLDPEIWQQAGAELLAERKRLAYVALTRAKNRLIFWWPHNCKANTTESSGLHELLLDRGEHLSPQTDDPMQVLRSVAELDPAAIGIHPVVPTPASSAPPVASASPGVQPSAVGPAARFTRPLDRTVNRLSFTGITRVAFPYEDRHNAPDVSADPDLADDSGSLDENPDEVLDEPLELTDDEVLLAALPAGREPGTRLHGIYEIADFGAAAGDRDRQISELVDEAFVELSPEVQERVVEGIVQTFDVPLGPELHDRRLADIARVDRLDEMQFDLPLRTGVNHAATLVRLGDLVIDHLDAERRHRELLSAWAEELRDPRRAVRLGGFLTGSIDLLFRYQPEADGPERYVVADYKSNKIARWPESMTPDVFSEDRLANEMLDGQYLLQALLYLLGTHRFLGARLPGYEPDRHLGPAAYLFVRGMTGDVDDDGRPHGVFTWRPSTELIVATDKLLLRAASDIT